MFLKRLLHFWVYLFSNRGYMLFRNRAHHLLFSGKHMKYGRMDILGELKPEHYPEWINSKIKELDVKKKDHKEKERWWKTKQYVL